MPANQVPMEIGKTLYVKTRNQWRRWLQKNHSSEPEIWLVYYNKQSGKPRIPYNDAVEEALCYGWIDSTAKKIDKDSTAQRFSPRRKNSALSELNKERVRRLIKSGMMTEFGLESIKHHLKKPSKKSSRAPELRGYKLPADIVESVKANKAAWKNFKKFPEYYRNIRIAFIEGARKRPEVFRKRLEYFLKMTSKNKRFGMVQ